MPSGARYMSTRLIRSTYNITPNEQGSVLTIGNFDGVHLGHQELLKRVKERARAYHVPSLVLTFEPHPFEYFQQADLTIPRITRLREKFCTLQACGIDNVLILNFNQSLANISASDFVSNVLYNTLRPVHIVLGDDFRFGYKREGDFALLQAMGDQLGFSVEAMPTISRDGERISSTRIREALVKGDLNLVKRLLGHPYTMLGRVRRGDQRGRLFGFPTANIFLHRKLTPVKGVYTVLVHGLSDQAKPGIANIGIRPTVDGTSALLEVHLLNFNDEIYGRYVKVEFCEKVRDEIRFPNIDLLKEQIAKDVAYAHKYFKNNGVI